MSTAPATNDDMDQLHQRLCDLPPELYCIVKDFTLAIESDQTITIGNNYHPPVQLQIDRALRQTASQRFYSTNTFRIEVHDNIKLPNPEGGNSWGTSLVTVPKIKNTFPTYLAWKNSLPSEHLQVVWDWNGIVIARD